VREPFIGSEAVAAGALTKTQLATRCRRLFPDVYVERDVDVDAELRAKAGGSGPDAEVLSQASPQLLCMAASGSTIDNWCN
jgi:hypothetical protein